MHIGKPQVTRHDDRVRWTATVDGPPELPEQLWFEVARSHEGLITDRADPAVIGLLIPAMQRGLPLEIEGPVTDELVHALTHGYQDVYSTVIPGLRMVTVDAGTTLTAGPAAGGVATGFSGGVDSFAVLAEHHFASVAPSLRLTHLTFFNVGAMGSGDSGRSEFERLYASLLPVADRIGLPLVAVDSNLDDFYPKTLFAQNHGPRNLAAAALLLGGIGRYFAAGSVAFPYIGVYPAPNSSRADPIATPLLVNRQFHPISHGDRLSRVQKTLLVAELPVARQSLTVCTGVTPDGRNCSTCDKCLRTELTLEIAGHLDAFDERFELGAFREARASFVDRVLTTDRPHHVEIREFATRTGYPLPSVRGAFVRRAVRGLRHRSALIARSLRPGDRGERAS